MVPSLLARVDGLPVTLLDRQVVWPIPAGERNGRRRPISSKERARIERQAAAEAERLEIRSDLSREGLL